MYVTLRWRRAFIWNQSVTTYWLLLDRFVSICIHMRIRSESRICQHSIRTSSKMCFHHRDITLIRTCVSIVMFVGHCRIDFESYLVIVMFVGPCLAVSVQKGSDYFCFASQWELRDDLRLLNQEKLYASARISRILRDCSMGQKRSNLFKKSANCKRKQRKVMQSLKRSYLYPIRQSFTDLRYIMYQIPLPRINIPLGWSLRLVGVIANISPDIILITPVITFVPRASRM